MLRPSLAQEPVSKISPKELLSLAFQSDTGGGSLNDPFAVVPPAPMEDSEKRPEGEAEEREIDPSRKFGQEAPPVRPPITYLRDEVVLLKKGQWMFDMGLVYSLEQAEIPTIIPPGALTEAKVTQRSVYSPFALRYGVTDNLQAQVYLPVGFSSEKIDVIGDRTYSDTDGPIGDTIVSFNYALPSEWFGEYNVIWTNMFVIPTGNDHMLALGPDAAFGNGWFEYGSSVIAIRRYDPLLVFGGFGARYAFEKHVDGVSVERGLAIDYQLGVGFGVNDTMSLSAKFFGSFETRAEYNGHGAPGTERDIMALRFALTKAQENVIWEPFVTLGLTSSTPDAQIGVVLTFK